MTTLSSSVLWGANFPGVYREKSQEEESDNWNIAGKPELALVLATKPTSLNRMVPFKITFSGNCIHKFLFF